MADIKPFYCIRPVEEKAARIAALPYDVYSRTEARQEIEREPLSFLRIDRAEVQFEEEINSYDMCVYQRAHDTLWEMVEQKDFLREQQECYYVYELVMDGRASDGIVACVSIDDFLNGVIKKHEATREEKEADRMRHIDACNAQTGPIFLSYRSKEAVNQLVEEVKQEEPIYDFTASDGVRHRVFRISEPERIQRIRYEFRQLSKIYIADGHHRAASAVKVGIMKREQQKSYTGQEEFNYVLSVLFPDEQLKIMEYNRVVKDLNGYAAGEFLKKVKEIFQVTKVEREACLPKEQGEFSMFLEQQWYLCRIPGWKENNHPVEDLDVSVLQKRLLEPVLGIENPRTDKRIDFVGGIRGIQELERRVETDCKVAFAMYPISLSELFAVADAGLFMPPKSTWFEPKLRSGLFIHEI